MREREVVGVLGGTFDPVHLGHLALAETVRDRTGLKRIRLLPCAAPPHKDPSGVAPAEHRAAMLAAAILDRPGLELCDLELRSGVVQYSIDTLRTLRRDGELEPVFLLGLDSLVEIPTWRRPAELLAEFDLIVVDRSVDPPDLTRLAAELQATIVEAPEGLEGFRRARLGMGGRVFHLPMACVPISSRDVRARAAAGLGLRGLVPDSVARYILDKGLYRRAGTEEERR